MQEFSDQSGLAITVCHDPPGTSKWNKIEHRLFSYITKNWRGKPLVSYEVIVQLIAATKTKSGLEVRCELDQAPYQTGRKVSDEFAVPLCRSLHRSLHGVGKGQAGGGPPASIRSTSRASSGRKPGSSSKSRIGGAGVCPSDFDRE